MSLSTPVPVVVTDDGFHEFVLGSQTRMVHLAELLTRDRGRAEDLAQHAYAKAYASWGRIHGGDPEAYVRRCIVNANIDWWRRRTWQERPSEHLPEPSARDVGGSGGGSGGTGVGGIAGDPAAAVAQRDLVLGAMARLTARERSVLALRFYLDLPEAQIASELGLRPGTVKSTLARALGKLRQDSQLQAERSR